MLGARRLKRLEALEMLRFDEWNRCIDVDIDEILFRPTVQKL